MKFINLLIILVLLCSSLFQGCKSSKIVNSEIPENASTPKVQFENALLWRISGNGLAAPSYIFGTIHIIDSENYFLPKGTLEAIESCTKMIFEIDISEFSNPENMIKIASFLFMDNNVTIKDLLSEEDYDLVIKEIEDIGLPMMFVERIKPMFMSFVTMEDIDPSNFSNGDIKSYELEFMEIAKDLKLEIGGLESLEFQLTLFDSIPYEVQAKMLVQTIKEKDMGSAEFKEMIELYKSQNISAMANIILEDSLSISIDNFNDILLTKRNHNWIPIIDSTMKNSSVFIAVGAGHLAGEHGILHLLERKGYTIKPILP